MAKAAGFIKNLSPEVKLLLLLLVPVAVVILLHYLITGFIIYNDGMSYYIYGRSLVIDRDLNFTNEWNFYNTSYSKFSSVPRGINAPQAKTPKGYPESTYLIGNSVMWLPFFLTAHAAAMILSSLGLPVRADGYSWPYEIAIGLATLIYGFFAMLLIYKFCTKWFDKKTSLLATIAVWYGTAVFWYHAIEPSLSHINSMLAITAFTYFWHNTLGKRTKLQWLLLGLLLGLIYLVRQQDILLGILPMLELLKRSLRGVNLYMIRKTAAEGLTFATGAITAILPQMLAWKKLYGSYIVYSYANTAQYWHWTIPQLLPFFLSPQHGMWKVPVMLAALIGLAVFTFRRGGIAWYFLAVVVAEILVTSAWTGWMNGYGQRFLLGTSAFLTLGAAELIQKLKEKAGMKAVVAAMAALIAANAVNMTLVMLKEVTSKVPLSEFPNIIRSLF
ncbi:glycosyltransferase family 39 protein [Candidatus Woesearchaeota archaeon]|nr:glycosyltransferase family 39 protein [Candidatus Woesearchaeota archaeon]